MSEGAEKGFNRVGGIFSLWSGLLVAPFAFLLNLQVSYMLVPFVCATGRGFLLYVAAVGSLMLVAMCLLISWHNWHKSGRKWQSEGGSIMARSRFLSVM